MAVTLRGLGKSTKRDEGSREQRGPWKRRGDSVLRRVEDSTRCPPGANRRSPLVFNWEARVASGVTFSGVVGVEEKAVRLQEANFSVSAGFALQVTHADAVLIQL